MTETNTTDKPNTLDRFTNYIIGGLAFYGALSLFGAIIARWT